MFGVVFKAKGNQFMYHVLDVNPEIFAQTSRDVAENCILYIHCYVCCCITSAFITVIVSFIQGPPHKQGTLIKLDAQNEKNFLQVQRILLLNISDMCR